MVVTFRSSDCCIKLRYEFFEGKKSLQRFRNTFESHSQLKHFNCCIQRCHKKLLTNNPETSLSFFFAKAISRWTEEKWKILLLSNWLLFEVNFVNHGCHNFYDAWNCILHVFQQHGSVVKKSTSAKSTLN